MKETRILNLPSNNWAKAYRTAGRQKFKHEVTRNIPPALVVVFINELQGPGPFLVKARTLRE